MKSFYKQMESALLWLPEKGMGYYPSSGGEDIYDRHYYLNYVDMADTEMGLQLTKSRIELVKRHFSGSVLDVGIGSGQFVMSRRQTLGYDINSDGIKWLRRQGCWADLYQAQYPALSFWDSLEHIPEPDIAVSHSLKWVFLSLPIFRNAEHILESRHFKPSEHIWYWTHNGIINWFKDQGFILAEHNSIESQLGREDIGSYAFTRLNL